VDGADLVVTLDACRAGGRGVGVRDLLSALGVSEKVRPHVRVVREAVILNAPSVAVV
jgi:hypothetical protein